MACKHCEERAAKLRRALIAGQMAESLKQAGAGAAELVGLKKKTGADETPETGPPETQQESAAEEETDEKAGPPEKTETRSGRDERRRK